MAETAKRIGVSDRHCRRIAAQTRAALNVDTNHQALAVAVQLGLVTSRRPALPETTREPLATTPDVKKVAR